MLCLLYATTGGAYACQHHVARGHRMFVSHVSFLHTIFFLFLNPLPVAAQKWMSVGERYTQFYPINRYKHRINYIESQQLFKISVFQMNFILFWWNFMYGQWTHSICCRQDVNSSQSLYFRNNDGLKKWYHSFAFWK